MQDMNLLSLDIDPDPRSPITPGCLGPVTTRFNCKTELLISKLQEDKPES